MPLCTAVVACTVAWAGNETGLVLRATRYGADNLVLPVAAGDVHRYCRRRWYRGSIPLPYCENYGRLFRYLTGVNYLGDY